MTTNRFGPGLVGLAVSALVGCGGSGGGTSPSSPIAATRLAYADPASGTYLLKKDVALSTATHLVLDLVGPSGAAGSGICVSLTADTAKVTWSTPDPSSTLVKNQAFDLGGTTPRILLGKVTGPTGSTIQVAAAQKGTGDPVSLDVPILSVAVDLVASTTPGPVALDPVDADGSGNPMCIVIDGAGAISPIAVTVGTLTAQ